jgi:hypothetical protein
MIPRCVPLSPLGTVVRAIDQDGDVCGVEWVDGQGLTDLADRFLANPRVNRLNIYSAANDSYAGRAVRHDKQ